MDHLGGDGDSDLLGILCLDGNADRQVQPVDLVLRKALLLQASPHKGRLAARAKATQIGGLGAHGLNHHVDIGLVACCGHDHQVARTDGALLAQVLVVDQTTVVDTGYPIGGQRAGAVVARHDGKARRREHPRRRSTHVAAAKDIGQALGAERLDVRGRNLGGGVGVGGLTPLLHQRKPGAARNGAARFLAMILGNIAFERVCDKRFKVDDEVADASICQDVGNRLEQRCLGRVQVQIAQADGSAADHAGIGVLAAHGVADQTRLPCGQQLARLVQRKELDLAAADGTCLAAIGKDGHPGAHAARR